MTWTAARPFLFFLPLFLCLSLHIFLSAGFLLGTRPGLLRFFLYLISCLYLISYFLIFNHGLTLATTKIRMDFPGRYIRYENQYGSLRIPAEEIQAAVVEGPLSDPSVVWIQSKRQVFYLDRRFPRYKEFLPLLQSFLELDNPQVSGGKTILRAGGYRGEPDLNPGRNVLRGNLVFFLPWLALFPIIAYFLAGKAWLGHLNLFKILALLYYLPVIIIGLFCRPDCPLVFLLVLYPVYPLFLSAMCLPDNSGVQS